METDRQQDLPHVSGIRPTERGRWYLSGHKGMLRGREELGSVSSRGCSDKISHHKALVVMCVWLKVYGLNALLTSGPRRRLQDLAFRNNSIGQAAQSKVPTQRLNGN